MCNMSHTIPSLSPQSPLLSLALPWLPHWRPRPSLQWRCRSDYFKALEFLFTCILMVFGFTFKKSEVKKETKTQVP